MTRGGGWGGGGLRVGLGGVGGGVRGMEWECVGGEWCECSFAIERKRRTEKTKIMSMSSKKKEMFLKR